MCLMVFEESFLSTMSQSYEQVRDAFSKICADLEYTERKLESEATLQALDTGVDVADLLKRISSLKSRILPIQQKQLQIYWAKQELLAAVDETLITSAAAQEAVRLKSGLPSNLPDSAVAQSLRELKHVVEVVGKELEGSSNQALKGLEGKSTRQCSPDDIFPGARP